MHDNLLLQLAIILIGSRLLGLLFDRLFKVPAVLGEILAGVLMGAGCLGWIHPENATLIGMATIGGVLLLFEVGLQSDIDELYKVGGQALWVACWGVLASFGGVFLLMRALGQPSIVSMFIGGAVSATSVGITARVFSDLKALSTKEARLVLGAAVADDVIGLILVAVVTGIAVTHSVSAMGLIKLITIALVFLVGAVLLGPTLTPRLLHYARKLKSQGMLPIVAVILALLMSTLAEMANLAAIVGAFAAGLALAKTEHKEHFEPDVRALANLFIPIFFVMIGAQVHPSLFNPMNAAGRQTLIIGLMITAVVLSGKWLAGVSVPGRSIRRNVVGVGMFPRGEVTLIAAGIGLQNHVLDIRLYAAMVFVVLASSFITPPVLKMLLARKTRAGS